MRNPRNPAATALAALLVVVMLFVPAAANPDPAAADAPTTDALSLVLDRMGLERRDFAPDPFRAILPAARRNAPALLARMLASPLDAPYVAGSLETMAARQSPSPHRLLLMLSGLADTDMARGAAGNPLARIDQRMARARDPLADAVAELARITRTRAADFPVPTQEELPGALRHEVARLVNAAGSAERFRSRALADSFLKDPVPIREALMSTDTLDMERMLRASATRVHRESLNAGLLDLAMATEDFDSFLASPRGRSLPPVMTLFETPLGTVLVNTRDEDSSYSLAGIGAVVRPRGGTAVYLTGSRVLLLIDTRGDDYYMAGDVPQTAPVQVLIDGAGNDTWDARGGMALACGMLGYGVVWDRGGNDRYVGTTRTQASALLGGAMLHDGGGDDRYEAMDASQGHAFCGLALLHDVGGNDAYLARTDSQASAGPLSAAMLMDLSGDDRYHLSDVPLAWPSPQSPGHNLSSGQGAGMGSRDDLGDGRSLPGGVGILADLSGNDSYRASVFAQGVGFWEGVGLLIDDAGDDTYEAVWYAQGASAHRAAGGLIDRAGNDTYTTRIQMAQGAGHDFGIGFLVDESGNDAYTSGNLAQGAANENSTGVLCDADGDDSYSITEKGGIGLGESAMSRWGTLRESALGAAIFMDLGGRDRYRAAFQGPGDDTLWSGRCTHAQPGVRSEFGAGIDTRAPNPLRTRPITEPPANEAAEWVGNADARRAYRKAYEARLAKSGS